MDNEIPDSRIFVELEDGSYRRPTDIELEDGKALKARIKQDKSLAKVCKHNLFFDESGWPYDTRECYICGQGLGAI